MAGISKRQRTYGQASTVVAGKTRAAQSLDNLGNSVYTSAARIASGAGTVDDDSTRWGEVDAAIEQAHSAAILSERQRLARELHDSVSQALYSIALGSRTARALLDPENPAVESVEFVLAQAELALAEMRALIFELRPEALEQEGLVAALERKAHSLRARHQLTVDVGLGPEPNVPLDVKEALYRIAQEALHNTVKHAGARRVRLSLSVQRDHVMLCLEDDGQGFDVTADFPGHYGLQSMRERAETLGGTTQIQSAPGTGTIIRAVLPRAQALSA